MIIRIFSLLVLFSVTVAVTEPLFAQKPTTDTNLRRVYWLHDINEDNIDATLVAPNSNFWLNYAGTSRTTEDECATQGQGYFRSNYKMEPFLLSYYTDRPIPAGRYSVFTNTGVSLTRQKIGNSPSASDVSSQLRNAMNSSPGAINTQRLPFVIAQGAGSELALDINRRFPNTEFGGIISIGGAHQGIPLINSVSNGRMDAFDKNMKKTFMAGYEKYAEKVEAKVLTTAISLGLGLIGSAAETASLQGVKDEVVKQLIKLFTKVGFKIYGFVLSDIIKNTVSFEGALEREFQSLYPELENFLPPNDPKIFNSYIKSAYSQSNRALLADLHPNSPWTQLNSPAPNNIPIVSINGRFDKASYFQVMQTARWKTHTKNRCLDLKVEQMVPLVNNAPNPILIKRTVDITSKHENIGAESQDIYSYTIQQQGERFKTNYIAFSALAEGLKFAVSASGGPIGIGAGIVFGGIGMWQAVQTGDEIKASFEKGSKWVKNEADLHWAYVIGAVKDTTVTTSRIAWPNPAIKELPDPLPNGDYPRVNVQITLPVRLPHDGIVPASTQESPQERGWRSGNTPTGLNLEANKVDHFSQANHPRVRERIEATIRGMSSNLERVRSAFFVEP